MGFEVMLGEGLATGRKLGVGEDGGMVGDEVGGVGDPSVGGTVLPGWVGTHAAKVKIPITEIHERICISAS